jgi:hypothetical protein
MLALQIKLDKERKIQEEESFLLNLMTEMAQQQKNFAEQALLK